MFRRMYGRSLFSWSGWTMKFWIGAGEGSGRDADDPPREVQRDDADGDHDQRDEEPATHEFEDGQREEVEADIGTEDRIGDPKWDLVHVPQEHVPLVAAGETEEECRDEE